MVRADDAEANANGLPVPLGASSLLSPPPGPEPVVAGAADQTAAIQTLYQGMLGQQAQIEQMTNALNALTMNHAAQAAARPVSPIPCPKAKARNSAKARAAPSSATVDPQAWHAGWLKAQLEVYARAHGVRVTTKMSKADLVRAIEVTGVDPRTAPGPLAPLKAPAAAGRPMTSASSTPPTGAQGVALASGSRRARKTEENEMTVDWTLLCPMCETGPMVARQNRVTARWFYGCRHYPACDGTRTYAEGQAPKTLQVPGAARR